MIDQFAGVLVLRNLFSIATYCLCGFISLKSLGLLNISVKKELTNFRKIIVRPSLYNYSFIEETLKKKKHHLEMCLAIIGKSIII